MDDQRSETTGTALSVQSTGRLDLMAVPERLSDPLMSQLRAIALAPPRVYEPSSREHFDKCMRGLAILPRKIDDDLKGEYRLELYWRKLREYPAAAITWLLEHGLDRFEWFPSIKQCKEVLDVWPGPAKARHWKVLAGRLIERELKARYDDLKAAICRGEYDEDQVNALGDKTKRMLDTDGVLIGERTEFCGPVHYRIRPSALEPVASPEFLDKQSAA
jgi:hypothetical protein